MKNILICNQKGGVGKSLIADELAFSFERTKTPMSFFDLDGQGGVIHRTSQATDAQVAVIDTPGAFQQQLRDWIKQADVIIVPTKTTSRDIEPLMRMVKALQAAKTEGKPILYVLNGWNRWRASADFLEWFARFSSGAPTFKLPQSEQFVQASAAGISVVEYARHGSAAHATLELCNAVRKLAGFKKER